MCSYTIVTNRKLSHERGQDPPPLPAGPFCGGGGPALEATRFGVLVGSVPVDGAQAAWALDVARGVRMPGPDSVPAD